MTLVTACPIMLLSVSPTGRRAEAGFPKPPPYPAEIDGPVVCQWDMLTIRVRLEIEVCVGRPVPAGGNRVLGHSIPDSACRGFTWMPI